MKLIAGFFASLLLNIASWILAAMGLPVVWVALYFVKPSGAPIPFTQFPELGFWQMWNLPAWARWWDNVFDGMGGDKRGWWANNCLAEYGIPHTHRFCMWVWAAVRNPANYFNRNICGIDVTKTAIRQVFLSRHVSILSATHTNGLLYPRIVINYEIKNNKGILIEIGWKIKMEHNNVRPDDPASARIKGIQLAISPWRDLA